MVVFLKPVSSHPVLSVIVESEKIGLTQDFIRFERHTGFISFSNGHIYLPYMHMTIPSVR